MALLILNCGYCEQSLAEHRFTNPNRTIHIPYPEHLCEDETHRIPGGTTQVNIASTDPEFEFTVTIFPEQNAHDNSGGSEHEPYLRQGN